MASETAVRDQVLTFKPLRDIGAEVVGLDLDHITPDAARALREAWATHGLLLFPKTRADTLAQVRLAGLFGQVQPHVVTGIRTDDARITQLGGEGEKKGIALVVNGQTLAGFFYLHQDGTFGATVNEGAILRLVKAPATGGDTQWIDMEKVYEALPAHLRRICETHETVHQLRDGPSLLSNGVGRLYGWPDYRWRFPEPREQEDRGRPPVVHSMAMTNPRTGKRTLILSPLTVIGIVGMDQAASDAFYDEIVAFLMQPRFSYRHSWSEGDMILYDNRRTMHAAFGYPFEDERIMHRTDLAPPAPTGRALTLAELAEFAGRVRV